MDLWEAVRYDDVSKVRSLLEEGADPNHQLYWSEDWYSIAKKFRRPPQHVRRASWRSPEHSLVVELTLREVMDYGAGLHFTGRVGEDIWRLWCTCHKM